MPAGFEVAGSYLLPEIRIEGTGAVIAELSGAWYDEQTRELLAVIDRRDQSSLITMDLSVAPDARLRPTRVVRVERARANRTMDLEGVAPAQGGHVYISSEGEAANPEAPSPGVFEYTREGRYVRSLPIPAAYAGLRSNLGFEALSASPDGRRLFVGAESSLRQDGGPATADAGALTRILVLDPTSLAGPREYAYRTEPVPRIVPDRAVSGDNGIPEILALGSSDLLVLERGYVVEQGSGGRSANGIRIFHVHLDPGAEVTGRWSLKETPPAATLRKTLVLDLATLASQLPPRLANLENFEAMSFGPVLPDGRRTLLLLSDNNCSDRQVTALIVLAYRAPVQRH